MAETIDHDALFKTLLKTFFFEFLELFLPAVAAYVERDSIQFLDKEIFTDVKGKDKHIADLVAPARFRGEDAFFLLHTEPMARSETDFPARMFRYFARLFEEYRLPIYPIALFSHDAPLRAEPDRFDVVFPDFAPLQFQFRLIQLNRLDWRDFLGRPNPIASALMAKMRIAEEEPPIVKAECLRLLVGLQLDAARSEMIATFVDTYLRLNPFEKQVFEQKVAEFAPPQKEKAMEYMTSWKLEGIEMGKLEGEQTVTLRLLRRRVGRISETQEAQIRRLPLERLEDLAEALLDFTQPADLENWLKAEADNEE